MDDPSRIMIVT